MKSLIAIFLFIVELILFGPFDPSHERHYLNPCPAGPALEQLSVEQCTAESPTVKLTLATGSRPVRRGAQVRYSIQVEDPADGFSRYGEIPPAQVFLSVRFFPDGSSSSAPDTPDDSLRLFRSPGLSLLGRGGCFSCHADENSITGPAFSEIAGAYHDGKRAKPQLAQSIQNGSEGVWGNMAMPAHQEFSEKEVARMVAYILQQGECRHCRVYPGLEGVFKIRVPAGIDSGTYKLTATYTSSSGQRGQDTKTLKVK